MAGQHRVLQAPAENLEGIEVEAVLEKVKEILETGERDYACRLL